MPHTVCIINGNDQYYRMFGLNKWHVTVNPDQADVIQFCGGADVSPHLYKSDAHSKTMNSEKRDEEEVKIYRRYVGRKALVGICRGAQFLWVMNGGRMYQHVEGHAIHGTHDVVDLKTFDIREVTSTHHQMMMHTKETVERARMVAVANHCTHKEWVDGELTLLGHGDQCDIEVAAFPDTRTLCFQPHPEFGRGDCQDYYFECLEQYVVPHIYQG